MYRNVQNNHVAHQIILSHIMSCHITSEVLDVLSWAPPAEGLAWRVAKTAQKGQLNWHWYERDTRMYNTYIYIYVCVHYSIHLNDINSQLKLFVAIVCFLSFCNLRIKVWSQLTLWSSSRFNKNMINGSKTGNPSFARQKAVIRQPRASKEISWACGKFM